MEKPLGMFGNHHSSMVHDMARMPILQCDWIGAAESSVPIGLERLRARLCSAAKFFEFPLNLVRSFFFPGRVSRGSSGAQAERTKACLGG